ncbi:MAG: PQQ-dependent sugar dehydrogenase [Gammaproteobacteria bacterium]
MKYLITGLLIIGAAGLRAAPAADSGVAFQRVFPRLSFERPLFLAAAPGDARRLFVAEQGGLIRAFDRNDPARTTVFLDLSRKVSRAGEEEGLLGLAFHPQYATNGQVYVYYSGAGQRHQVVARYTADAARGAADPASEKILIEMTDPYRNHNGGMLAFGPDGMLYIGTGDGGSGGDPLDSGQRLDTLLGKILRVTPEAAVPADNPFVKTAGARGEIWAWGLRNPWRFSFDRQTGALWAADVGQNAWEEIDVIVMGGNYGWRLFEGNAEYENPKKRPARDFIAPVTVYDHDDGCSVTGGYVYRGKSVPAAQGRYFYADFCTGSVWAVPADGKPQRHGKPLARVPQPSSFGEDDAGELYITSFDGGIYQLVPRK